MRYTEATLQTQTANSTTVILAPFSNSPLKNRKRLNSEIFHDFRNKEIHQTLRCHLMEMFQNQILHTQWQALESPLERLAGSILHTS